MTLENTLEELAERRTAFKAFRENVEAELRKLRVEKLSSEQASIEHIVVKAMSEGATLGQVKRAYGTKDHRTIATIVTVRAHEIEALQKARQEQKASTDWFRIEGDTALVELPTGAATFTWAEVDGELMFSTDEPRWNADWTTENKAVALLDGKTESSSDEARTLAKEIRKQG